MSFRRLCNRPCLAVLGLVFCFAACASEPAPAPVEPEPKPAAKPKPVAKPEPKKPAVDSGGGAAAPAPKATSSAIAALGGEGTPAKQIPTIVAPGPMAGGKSTQSVDADAAVAGAKKSSRKAKNGSHKSRKAGKAAPRKARVDGKKKKKSDEDLPMSLRVAVAKADPKLPKAPKRFDESDVGRVVRQHQSDIKYCYEQAVRRVSGLKGKLVAEVTIEPDGSVSKAHFVEDSVRDRKVTRCVKRRVLRWQFASFAGKPETVSVPFLFEATN